MSTSTSLEESRCARDEVQSVCSQSHLIMATTSSSTTPEVTVPNSAAASAATGDANTSHPAPHYAVAMDEAEARRILRRIDWRLMPLLFSIYMFNFMDKTILSSAAVFGLREDNGLVGSDYSWVSSVFYFGYFAWTYPTTILIARLPIAKYMALNTFFWGAVVALTAACSSFGGLVTVRFLLGVAEATVSPSLMFVTSTWYTRDEIPVRTGIWFAGNSVGGIIASLLAYGIGHIDDGLHPWRYMFIILGAVTFCLGFGLFFVLPDSISRARFLTPEQRQWAADRVVIAGTGSTENTVWKWDQTLECLRDPKTWFIWSIALLCQIPNGGTQNFANLVITSFGFDSLQSTLINIPYSLICVVVISATGWLAGRLRSLNCILIAVTVLPPVVGSALIGCRDRLPHSVALFGYFLLSTGPASLPLILSLVQSNFRGVTKKMTMTALLFIAYCAGNIAGPFLFKSSEEPTYDTAFRAIMICYALAIVLVLTLRFYLQAVNRKRANEEGITGNAGTSGLVGDGRVVDEADGRNVTKAMNELQLRPEDYDDRTDWKTLGFRYRL